MELLVLTKLRWELSSPTSLQFLHLLLLKMQETLSDQITPANIQKEAETFLMLAATEYKFHKIKPSVLVGFCQHSIHQVEKHFNFQACVSILTAEDSRPAHDQAVISNLLSRLVNISQTVLCQILAEFKLSVSSWIKIAGVSNNNQQLELNKAESCQSSEMMEIS